MKNKYVLLILPALLISNLSFAKSITPNNVNSNNTNSVSLKENEMIRKCSFLTEKTSNNECIKEQKDEELIIEINNKGYNYYLNNVDDIINKINTMIGVYYFIDKLNQKMLSADVLTQNENEKVLEFNNAKKILLSLNKKMNLLENNYELEINKWKKNDENKELVKFSTNRENLLVENQKLIKIMNKRVDSLNYYIETKNVSKKFFMPLYMGENIKVNQKECEIIKLNMFDVYLTNKTHIKGCK